MFKKIFFTLIIYFIGFLYSNTVIAQNYFLQDYIERQWEVIQANTSSHVDSLLLSLHNYIFLHAKQEAELLSLTQSLLDKALQTNNVELQAAVIWEWAMRIGTFIPTT
jgi:hypothetical protein